MLEDMVISFSFNGKRYRGKLDMTSVQSVAYRKKGARSVPTLLVGQIESVIERLGYSNEWVNVTHVNKEIGGVGPAAIAKILNDMGYTDSFRVKIKGEYQYVRYSPFLIEEREIREQLKSR